jgi:hypothetical protein
MTICLRCLKRVNVLHVVLVLMISLWFHAVPINLPVAPERILERI